MLGIEGVSAILVVYNDTIAILHRTNADIKITLILALIPEVHHVIGRLLRIIILVIIILYCDPHPIRIECGFFRLGACT
jgi:hypothetical protein